MGERNEGSGNQRCECPPGWDHEHHATACPLWRVFGDCTASQVVVAPPLGRVVRYKRDQVGNDLTATLMWCALHHEPVWVYGDGSYECPHTRIVGWSPDEHPIVPPPWEVLGDE